MTGHSSKALETDFDSMPDELAEIARAALERVVESGALDVDNWSTQDRSTFCRLLACSDYATGVMRRQTAWLCESVAAGRFDAPPAASYEYAGDKEDEAAIRRSLRQYRHRTLTHIMWRDFSGQATLEESLHSLSALADEMLNAASELAARVLDDRLGRPRNDKGEEIPLVILAMGKLGGGELNFSSDVDVIFL